MYGKFEKGLFRIAPRRISEEEALAHGYKPVVLTPPPETDDEHYPVEWLEETEAEFVRHWNIEEIGPPAQEIDEAEALAILLGGTT